MSQTMIRNKNDILSAKDIMIQYDLSRDYVYQLLKSKGCPLLSGKKVGSHYKIIRHKFEEFIGFI